MSQVILTHITQIKLDISQQVYVIKYVLCFSYNKNICNQQLLTRWQHYQGNKKIQT